MALESDDPFDPKNLLLPVKLVGESAPKTKPPRCRTPKTPGDFIYRIQVAWFQKAHTTRSLNALYVGAILWYRAGKSGRLTVKAAMDTCKQWGMGRSSKSHGLEQLEQAGLVTIKRNGLLSPDVTIVMVAEPEPEL